MAATSTDFTNLQMVQDGQCAEWYYCVAETPIEG